MPHLNVSYVQACMAKSNLSAIYACMAAGDGFGGRASGYIPIFVHEKD